jgi:O-acetylserine/cysteine efflux transporter
MPVRTVMLAVLVALIWGFNFVVMKWSVAQMPPLLLLFLRFALAAVPAVFFVRKPAVSWTTIAAYGLVFGVVKFGLLFLAFKLGMTAGIGSVLLQAQVFFTILFAGVISGERPSTRQSVALVLAAFGLCIIGWGSAAGDIGLVPFVLVVGAAASWGVANLISKRAGSFDALSFVVWTSAAAAPPLLALSLVFEGPALIGDAFATLDPLKVAAVFYLAYPVTLVALAIWAWLLSHFPAAAIAPYALLVPVFGLTSAAVVLGEVPHPASVLGCAVIAAALVMNMGTGRGVSRASRSNS